jgi:hypothetical protein
MTSKNTIISCLLTVDRPSTSVINSPSLRIVNGVYLFIVQKTNMTKLIQMIETLIDQLLLLLTSVVFVDFPLLGILLANPNGRYVVGGLAIVTGFIGFWFVLWIVQFLVNKQAKSDTKSRDNVAKADTANSPESKTEDGFQFFKRDSGEKSQIDDDAALAAIEQEMLAVRQLFADGHILKDVYVAETRRLYGKAKTLKI